MKARAEQGGQERFCQLVVHGGPRRPAVHAGAGGHRPDAGLCRQPRHHRRTADGGRFPLHRAPGRLCLLRRRHSLRRVASQPAPDPDPGGGRLCLRPDRCVPGAVRGRRCAGRAARAGSGRLRPAAVGIPQAQLRRPGRRHPGRPPAAGGPQAGGRRSCFWRRRWPSWSASPMSARPACCCACGGRCCSSGACPLCGWG